MRGRQLKIQRPSSEISNFGYSTRYRYETYQTFVKQFAFNKVDLFVSILLSIFLYTSVTESMRQMADQYYYFIFLALTVLIITTCLNTWWSIIYVRLLLNYSKYLVNIPWHPRPITNRLSVTRIFQKLVF